MAKWKLLLAFAILACVAGVAQAQGDMAGRAKRIQAALYSVLRVMALPGEEENVTQRFVLEMPGKVLSYRDYYPGDAYVEGLKSVGSDEEPFINIPPKVMENMFRLADVVPGLHPLRGGDTGQSFAGLYLGVLSVLDVRGFRQKGREALKLYNQAMKLLTEPVADPEDPKKTVPRLELYHRLEAKYNQKRLEMEETIEEKRRELGSLSYQVWFQQNFPILYTDVEAAYTEWLVYGQKDMLELYKAHIDTDIQGTELEDARIAMRSSATVSMDRTQTIYPVAFEPSNWYEALVPKVRGPTRDEIQMQLGDLRARKVMMEMMLEGEPSEDGQALVGDLEARRDEKRANVEEKTKEMQEARVACMAQRSKGGSERSKGGSKRSKGGSERSKGDSKRSEGGSESSEGGSENNEEDACQQYRLAQAAARQAAQEQGEVEAEMDNTQFLMASSDKSKKSIKTKLAQLEARIQRLEERLEGAAEALPAEAEFDGSDVQDSWMEFEFDTSRSSEIQERSKEKLKIDVEAEASGGAWSVSGGFHLDRKEQKFHEEMSNAECSIKAKIMKVTIKRPWFRANLFRNRNIFTRDGSNVSPGPMREDRFIREVARENYWIPQYATAFLLAKDVEIEFHGVSSKTVSHAVSLSISAHLEGSYGPFSASASVGYGKDKSSLSTQATADGLKIRIPGAQLVGYYLNVLPRFPYVK